MREYIGSLAPSKTVVLTTHEMDEADRMAHRVGIMDHGRLLVCDTPTALKRAHAGGEVLELRIETDARVDALLAVLPAGFSRLESVPGTLRLAGPELAAHLPEFLKGLESAGVEARDVTVRKPTLEDVFISLTGRGLRE